MKTLKSLTTLTTLTTILTLAALSTLPALGDLDYLKRDYTYLEKIPIGSISSYTDTYTDSKNRVTRNLLDNNKATEWISWKENIIWAEPYNVQRYFTSTVIDGTTNNTSSNIANNTLTVPATGAKFRQFRIFDSSAYDELKSLKAGTYTLTMRYRGEVTDDGATAFFGSWAPNDEHGNPLPGYNQEISIANPSVPTDWETRTFTFKIDHDITNAFCAIQPRIHAGTFEVDWAELSYQASAFKVDYSSLQADVNGSHNWPYQSGDDYIPALVTENGKTIARIMNPKKGYSFRLADNISIPIGTYKLRMKINAKGSESGDMMFMVGTTKVDGGYDSKNFTIRINPGEEVVESDAFTTNVENGNWIVCLPNNYGGNYEGDFDVEYVELVSTTPGQASISILNEGNATYNDNTGHTSIYTDPDTNNSIIRSHPLPTTRKVIVAVGDGSHTEEQYDNKTGFALENNHIYTVSYKIRSDKAGTVTTMLANSSNLNDNWNTSNVIGTSNTEELAPGVTKTVYTTIKTTGFADSGAVVLDLGYNLGRVEVTDLKVMDNYDATIREHPKTTGSTQTQSESLTAYLTMLQQQIRPMNNLSLSADATYTVTTRLKATEAGKLWVTLGSKTVGQNFTASEGWTDVICTISGVDATNSGELVLKLSAENGTSNSDN